MSCLGFNVSGSAGLAGLMVFKVSGHGPGCQSLNLTADVFFRFRPRALGILEVYSRVLGYVLNNNHN